MPIAVTDSPAGPASPRVRLLGPVEVLVDGQARPVNGLRRRAIVAALALPPGVVVGTRRLIEVAWADDAPATRPNTLQSHLTYLRREFGLRDAIRARGPGYLLDLGDEVTDAQLAEQGIRQAAQEPDPVRAAELLRTALALWRGRSLIDLDEVPWFREHGVRLEALRRSARHSLTEARLAAGDHYQLVTELGQAAERHSHDEALHRQLMLALYRSGRRDEALTVFQQLQHRLGRAADQASRELEAAILRRSPQLQLPTTVGVAGPVQPEALVERDRERDLIDAAVRRAVEQRSGTVVVFEGGPGVGKTALLSYAETTAAARGCTVATTGGWPAERDVPWACVRNLFDDADLPLQAYSLYWRIIDRAERGPLVLVVDDVQWMDEPSARFLAYLAPRVDRLPVVVAAAVRRDSTQVDEIIAALAPATHRLSPLTDDAATTLLAAATGLPRDHPVMAGCRRLSGGNPFLLHQLGRRIKRALTTGGDPQTALDETVPTVALMVSTQLAYFPPPATVAAQALAVLGGEAGVHALVRVSPAPAEEVLQGLGILTESAYVVEHAASGTYAFAHPLVGAAVYEAIDPAQRAELHARAAR
ncbi:BTAD domain-containing putative transcriptional regulator [Dactylosporangium sp. AC04546]|uniref:BTAD domain-containing putative transcriptional regulator n=1 Tax=Dactylosporangium sp. AC04546 TaxID=2862460 RepID=UPI001EDF061E|nr:BTAD domain-containing putative transcriptional regulator [Dactylosporangium sp. AC04546]WVK86988.1 BTAD domain-containing putative transcriptional regulator [Dactylosporangium sp. AC04546]